MPRRLSATALPPLLDCTAPTPTPTLSARALDPLRFPHSTTFLPAVVAQLSEHAQFRDALVAAHRTGKSAPTPGDVEAFFEPGLVIAVVREPEGGEALCAGTTGTDGADARRVCVGVDLLLALEEEARAEWTGRLETLHFLTTVVVLHAISRAFASSLAPDYRRCPSASLPASTTTAAPVAAEWDVERAMLGGWVLLEWRSTGGRGVRSAEGVYLRSAGAGGDEYRLEEARIRDWQSHLVTALALNLPFPSPHLTFSSTPLRPAPPPEEGVVREPVAYAYCQGVPPPLSMGTKPGPDAGTAGVQVRALKVERKSPVEIAARRRTVFNGSTL